MRQVIVIVAGAMGVLVLWGCGVSGAGATNGPTAYLGSMTLFEAAEDPSAIADLDAIIASGADVNAKDAEGMTALHHAVAADNADAVIRLIRARADATLKDAQGRSPEEAAEQEGKANAVRAFERAMM